MKKYKLLLWHLLFCILYFSGNAAFADELQPLKTVYTKSPRDTLSSFIESAQQAYTVSLAVRASYNKSSRLYLTVAEKMQLDQAFAQVEYAKHTMNLSELPAAVVDKVAMDSVLLLIEVLGRIDLPNMESVPDVKDMQAMEFKRWSIPGTDITIMRVEQGSRAGEYLFSPDTIEQLPNYYQRTKHLPYKIGALKGVYNSYRYEGAGLRDVIPLKWMAALPAWLKILILDQPVWRWIGITLLLLFAIAMVGIGHRLARSWSEKGSNTELRKHWAGLAAPVIMAILVPVVIHVLVENLRISEEIFIGLTMTLWVVFTIAIAWVVWSSADVIAETIVSSQNLLAGSIDSQLIRLALRLVSSMIAITVLVVGAQRLGIPAYSIITGLGIGGIAVALAAKDTLANLLGSLVIMFEKPFRVGHWIKMGDAEGVVESIGFRSTRIRTFHDSLLSIPSNTLVNTVVDNMGARELRRVRCNLNIKFNTEPQKIEQFVTGIKEIIVKNEYTNKKKVRVVFNDFTTTGLDILVSFFLKVPDNQIEQRERHNIMMAILTLAESIGIEFSAPGQTLIMEKN